MGFIDEFAGAGLDASDLNPFIRRAQFAADESVIEQGELNTNIYILETGALKLVYHSHSGREYTKGFIEPGRVFASLACTLLQEPSRFSAVCLNQVELEYLPAKAFGELMDSSVDMLKYANQMFRNLALRNEEREHDLLCLTAEERYQKFISQSPKIAQWISQKEISAFLGITPVALSRIRARNSRN